MKLAPHINMIFVDRGETVNSKWGVKNPQVMPSIFYFYSQHATIKIEYLPLTDTVMKTP